MNSSDEEEDVFSCGRCKREFHQMDEFMAHKKSKVCRKKTSGEPTAGSSNNDYQENHNLLSPQRSFSETHTVEVVESAEDRFPAHLFEDTQSAYDEGNLVIDTDERRPIKCQFCNLTIKNLKNLLQHFTEKHNIPVEKAPLENASSSDQMTSFRNKVVTTQSLDIEQTKVDSGFSESSAQGPIQLSSENDQENIEKGTLMKGLGLSSSLPSSRQTRAKVEKERDVRCDVCGTSFQSHVRLKTHLKSKSHKGKVTALRSLNRKNQGCQEKVINQSTLVSYEDNLTGLLAEDTIISVVDIITQEDKKEKKHTKPPRRKICAICKEDFPNQYELLRHLSEDHAQTDREKRPRRASLKLRLNVDEIEAGEEDSESDDESDSPAEGKRGDPNEPKECQYCGKVIPFKNYTVHVRRCNNKQKFECVLCQHHSRERYDFNIHIDHHKVWWDMSAELPDDAETSTPVITKEKPSVETRRENIFVEEIEDTTLSETDLAALGLMPRSKLEDGKKKQDLQMHGHTYATLGEQQSGKSEDEGDGDGDRDDLSGDQRKKGAGGSRLKCHPCDRWFHRSKLPDHMLKMHNMKKVFQCRDVNCLNVFDNLDEFVSHISKHSSKPMFQCGCTSCKGNHDGTEIDYAAAIKRLKMKNYYKKLTFKCETCWARFPSQERLNKHLRSDSHHYPCDICGKIQSSRSQFRSHMLSHQQTQRFLCEHCGKGFRVQRDLLKHVASHSSDKPFSCTECKKRFVFKAKLDRHITTVHSLIKPYVCTEEGCYKAFTRKDKLKDHMFTHRPSPPFMCAYCSKGFYRKDNLRDHEVYHTRQFKYKCNKCEKGFMRPKALSQHLTTDHPVQVDNKIITRTYTQAVTSPDHTASSGQTTNQSDLAGFTIPLDQQVLNKVGLSGGHAYAMLPPLHKGADMGKSSGLVGPSNHLGQSVNTLVQILPQGAPDMAQVTVQSSQGLPLQIQASSAASSQYKYTQEKLEQVTRQIHAVTQQLIVQQFGGELLQQGNTVSNSLQ